MDRPILIGPDAVHRPAAETPGVDRREAFADDHVWAGPNRSRHLVRLARPPGLRHLSRRNGSARMKSR
jgi:hypothetical protein